MLNAVLFTLVNMAMALCNLNTEAMEMDFTSTCAIFETRTHLCRLKGSIVCQDDEFQVLSTGPDV